MLNGLGRHVGTAEGTITIGDHLDVDGAAICILWAPAKQCSEEQKWPQDSQCALCWISHSLHLFHLVSTHPLQGPATDIRPVPTLGAKRLGMRHLCSLLPSLCLSYELVRERPG